MSITLFQYSNVFHDLVKFSLEKTLTTKKFDEIVVISDKKIDLSQPYRHISISSKEETQKKVYSEYSRFMLKDLYTYINTDFALITQYDGIACNSFYWDDKFYDYDYIGAPYNLNTWVLKEMRKHFQLPEKYLKSWIVGNGGFSLRSKKLLKVLHEDKNIKFFLGKNKWLSEDIGISIYYRDYLEEKHKIRFADVGIGSQFSVDRGLNEGLSYGFHGIHHLPFFFTEDECCQYYDIISNFQYSESIINYGIFYGLAIMMKYEKLINLIFEKRKIWNT